MRIKRNRDKMEEWTSHWTSRKVVGETVRDLKKIGFQVRHKWIDFCNLYIAVDYDPNLKACQAVPIFKFKQRSYKHRNVTYKLPYPDVYYTGKSVDRYMGSRIPEEHLFIDHNPGAPIYDNRSDAVPVSKIERSAKGTHMSIYCPLSPKQMANAALKKIKQLGWKKWTLFVCEVSCGMGGYVVRGNVDKFWDKK